MTARAFGKGCRVEAGGTMVPICLATIKSPVLARAMITGPSHEPQQTITHRVEWAPY